MGGSPTSLKVKNLINHINLYLYFLQQKIDKIYMILVKVYNMFTTCV